MKLKGIGEKRLSELYEHGINDINDLVSYYPSKYIDYSNIQKFDPRSKELQSLHVKCSGLANMLFLPRFSSTKIPMTDISSNNNLLAVWYNQPYIKKQIKIGEEYLLYGKMSPTKYGEFVVQSYKVFSSEMLRPIPIYKPIGSIKSSAISTAIQDILSKNIFKSGIPENIERQFDLISINKAYNIVHHPTSISEISLAKKRIDIDTYVKLLSLKDLLNTKKEKPTKYVDWQDAFIEFKKMIPFTLTSSQENAISEIMTNMTSEYVMNRLLEGDVGCGKTIVALFAMYIAYLSGYQSVMIAPTEILATQHYNRAKALFGDKINICLITAKTPLKERKNIKNNLKNGKISLVFGTHSILSDEIEFKDLVLTITDEQHRFGVEQRNKLSNKSSFIDTLVMSATPIPRSLALTLYGDLNITTIQQKPYANAKRYTHIINTRKEKQLFEYIQKECINGKKVYIVCPAIYDENMQNDISNIEYLIKKLVKYEFFSQNLTVLHGKQNKKTQQESISLFISGEKPILLSTTIIEVGVDISGADTMVIYDADRFGLSTLHQLRGRVGRGENDSHIFCVLKDSASQSAIDRLEYFATHESGFDVAEYDFKNRGAGSILGTKQHGVSDFDMNLNFKDYEVAQNIFKEIKDSYSDTIRDITLDARQKYANIIDRVVLN